jgi:hypothetical protein
MIGPHSSMSWRVSVGMLDLPGDVVQGAGSGVFRP